MGRRIRDRDARGDTLDGWFRWLGWGEYGESAPADVDAALAGGDRRDDSRRVVIRPTRLTIDADAAPTSAADVYLRLHLLSHRLAAPNSLNLDGVFGLLNTVAWTDAGPVAVADLPDIASPAAAPADRSMCGRSTSSRRWSTTWSRVECASPTPAAPGSVPTSAPVRP